MYHKFNQIFIIKWWIQPLPPPKRFEHPRQRRQESCGTIFILKFQFIFCFLSTKLLEVFLFIFDHDFCELELYYFYKLPFIVMKQEIFLIFFPRPRILRKCKDGMKELNYWAD